MISTAAVERARARRRGVASGSARSASSCRSTHAGTPTGADGVDALGHARRPAATRSTSPREVRGARRRRDPAARRSTATARWTGYDLETDRARQRPRSRSRSSRPAAPAPTSTWPTRSRDGGASAVAAASMFHFTEQTPMEAKRAPRRRGHPGAKVGRWSNANDTSEAERLEQLWAGEFGDEYVDRNLDACDGAGPFWHDLLGARIGCRVGARGRLQRRRQPALDRGRLGAGARPSASTSTQGARRSCAERLARRQRASGRRRASCRSADRLVRPRLHDGRPDPPARGDACRS